MHSYSCILFNVYSNDVQFLVLSTNHLFLCEDIFTICLIRLGKMSVG